MRSSISTSEPRAVSSAPAFEHQITSRLKLRHLRLIVSLDDHRKLNRAAADLGLTQPAASKMLSEIEKALGVPLFERLPRGIEPTRYGEALIRRTRLMLCELGQAGDEIAALRSEAGGAAAIGALTTPAAEILPEAIRAARARLTRLQIAVDVECSAVLIARLLEARLDFAIARIPEGVDAGLLSYEEIGTERPALVVRRGHPLAGRRLVRIAELAEIDWVLPTRGTHIRRSVETLLRRHGLPAPQPVLNSNSLMLAQLTVAETDAIAAVSAPVAALFAATGGFQSLPLEEPLIGEPYGLVSVRGRPLSPPARILYNIVRDLQHPAAAAAE